MATWDKIAGDVIAGVYDLTTIGFKRLIDDANIPTKAHATDSGFDLYAAEDVIIEPGETKIIPTGIAVQLPKGMEAQVRPRSGVTAKTKLRVQLGTIDNQYRGEIGVIVDNVDSFSAMFSSHIRGIDTHKHHMKYYAGKGFPNDGGTGVSNTSYIIR